jgi:hypothetical protein
MVQVCLLCVYVFVGAYFTPTRGAIVAGDPPLAAADDVVSGVGTRQSGGAAVALVQRARVVLAPRAAVAGADHRVLALHRRTVHRPAVHLAAPLQNAIFINTTVHFYKKFNNFFKKV